MEVTATALAERIGGTVEGDATVLLNRLPKSKRQCRQFNILANAEYEPHIYTTGASAAGFTGLHDQPGPARSLDPIE